MTSSSIPSSKISSSSIDRHTLPPPQRHHCALLSAIQRLKRNAPVVAGISFSAPHTSSHGRSNLSAAVCCSSPYGSVLDAFSHPSDRLLIVLPIIPWKISSSIVYRRTPSSPPASPPPPPVYLHVRLESVYNFHVPADVQILAYLSDFLQRLLPRP